MDTNKLDKILGNIKIIKEDAKPSEGIWYYYYLKPRWYRFMAKNSEFGSYGHPKFWEEYIVPKLVEYYGLNQTAAIELLELSYSMPRGRVSFSGKDTGIRAVVNGEEEQPETWYIDYGEDIPSVFDEEPEKRRLISGFNLTGPAIRDQVKFRKVKHEQMFLKQQEQIQKIIGEVPY